MVAECVVAFVSLAISLLFFVQTFSFPQVSADPGGLALFPRVFSILTVIPAVILIINYIKQKRNMGTKVALTQLSISKNKNIQVFSLTLLFPAVMALIGFLPVSVIFVFLLVKILGGKTKGAFFFSVTLSAILFYVFGILVGVRLPRGFFGNFL